MSEGEELCIAKLHYLEVEIKNLIEGLKSKDCEKEFFAAFNEENCQGHALAVDWFNRKGCDEFCRALPSIHEAVKKYWHKEFDEPLPDGLLSPNELLKTYICCKAKVLLGERY